MFDEKIDLEKIKLIKFILNYLNQLDLHQFIHTSVIFNVIY